MTHATSHQPFITRQFMAGNSPAVRIPLNMAFPHKTELLVIREGDRIIIEPKEKTLGDVPKLFHALNKYFVGERPDFDEDAKRDLISSITFPYLGIDMSDYAFNREELNAR